MLRWVLLLLLACEPTVRAPVAEALDVPPPPGQRALDVGPAPLRGQPGDVVTFDGEPVEVVDRRAVDGGIVLTVYADEAPARAWLTEGEVPVSEGGCRGR